MPRCVRITSVPPGEAPLWVRERWVGLSLPLAQRRASSLSFLTSGVLSMPKGFISWLGALFRGRLALQRGYLVESHAAVAVLAVNHPEAAQWWFQNTPRLFKGKRHFVFPQDSGHVVAPDDAP